MVTIAYAFYQTARGEKILVRAGPDVMSAIGDSSQKYDSKTSFHRLSCAVKGCGCGLKFVPQSVMLGTKNREAHFARLDNQQHNRAVCHFPNHLEDLRGSENTRKQNRRIEFMADVQTGAKIIYLNPNEKSLRDVSHVAGAYKAYLHHYKGHETVRQRGDVAYSIKSLKDLFELARQKSFDDPFWDKVKVLGQGYFSDFRELYIGQNYKKLFSQARHHMQAQTTQPVIVNVLPLEIPNDLENIYDRARKLYFIPCAPVNVNGDNAIFYSIQPVLYSAIPYALQNLEQGHHYAVWTGKAVLSLKNLFRAQAQGQAGREIGVPLYIGLNAPAHILEIAMPRPMNDVPHSYPTPCRIQEMSLIAEEKMPAFMKIFGGKSKHPQQPLLPFTSEHS